MQNLFNDHEAFIQDRLKLLTIVAMGISMYDLYTNSMNDLSVRPLCMILYHNPKPIFESSVVRKRDQKLSLQ